jgi:hypothetical protein
MQSYGERTIEQRNRGTDERMNRRTEEQTNRGTDEQRNRGTEEVGFVGKNVDWMFKTRCEEENS